MDFLAFYFDGGSPTVPVRVNALQSSFASRPRIPPILQIGRMAKVAALVVQAIPVFMVPLKPVRGFAKQNNMELRMRSPRTHRIAAFVQAPFRIRNLGEILIVDENLEW